MIKGKKGIIYKEILRIYFIIMSNKYHNSKIYSVKNNFDDEIYVGSTTSSLCKRMVKHRCDAKQRPYLSKFYTYINKNGIENFYIELIEEYKRENVEQLRKREGELIREIATLNERIAGRTKKENDQEWSKNNRDRINEKRNERRKENPEKTKEDYKRWGALYRERHPEKIKVWQKTKVQCECGGQYTLSHKAEHFKCKKHQQFINNQ